MKPGAENEYDFASETMASPLPWPAKELRLTRAQADYLRRGESSVHQRVTDRTELILSSRKMLAWKRDRSGEWYLGLSPKGDAALAKYEGKK